MKTVTIPRYHGESQGDVIIVGGKVRNDSDRAEPLLTSSQIREALLLIQKASIAIKDSEWSQKRERYVESKIAQLEEQLSLLRKDRELIGRSRSALIDKLATLSHGAHIGDRYDAYSMECRLLRVRIGCKQFTYEDAIKFGNRLLAALKRKRKASK